MPHARTTMHIQYYLPALTGARFVAAMAVAAAHCFNVVVFRTRDGWQRSGRASPISVCRFSSCCPAS